MVGFPGETDELFEENRAFIASLPFTYLHVFTYSSRPGTPSAEMAGQVPVPVAKERNRILRELVAARNLAFRESFVGGELDAITLGERSCESTHALSDNYLKVRIPGELAPNQWLRVRVNGLTTDGLSAYPA
jgi:threonylcarbamoyladenosine tRNA methylthiotransferase MtaB